MWGLILSNSEKLFTSSSDTSSSLKSSTVFSFAMFSSLFSAFQKDPLLLGLFRLFFWIYQTRSVATFLSLKYLLILTPTSELHHTSILILVGHLQIKITF